MTRSKILIQLDSDPVASSFDAIVAIDAGVQHLLSYDHVAPEQVRELIHGAMFTRGADDLKSTAVFIGGSDVAKGEQLLDRVVDCFFDGFRVSVMLDANGANTTAAAAALAAARHVPVAGTTALVLAATGPVGQRVARLLGRQGASVRVASRSPARAEATCESLKRQVPEAEFTPWETSSEQRLREALSETTIVIAAGAAGVPLLPETVRREQASLRVAIDLNVVPPPGLEGVAVHHRAEPQGEQIVYGAVGVGQTKMKIHREAVRSLFRRNDLILDAEAIFDLGRKLEME